MRKTAGIVLSVLLITSQWLVLAHATGHLLEQDRTHCTICSLREHQDDLAIIITLPPVVSDKPVVDACKVPCGFSSAPFSASSIRAPPASS